MKIILFTVFVFSLVINSIAFANSQACKITIKVLYDKYTVDSDLIEEAQSRCEKNNIEMQGCLTNEKFFNCDKTREGIKEVFNLCDAEAQAKAKNIYFY